MSKIYDELTKAGLSRQAVNVVSAGLRIKGEISGNEDLVVDGAVEGPIQLQDGTLTIGAAGKIISDVVAREIVVYGEVKGNLSARDRIEIKNNGSVFGDLKTARILIEDGATLKGSIEVINRDKSARSAAT
ncbi:MAG TPA: polymer-forming cytoskeletal protein [Candidatus Aquilonibacter sp.]|nr:polymer-forming cytoskeletal protein [Candidatus Aquilonibacter sp.]